MFLKSKEKVYIGEYYGYTFKMEYWYIPPFSYSPKFIRFTKEDISDEIGDKIKICGDWKNKSDVFYYDDIYKDIRSNIRTNYGKKESKNDKSK